MNQKPVKQVCICKCIPLGATAAVLLLSSAAFGQSIPNASFETDNFSNPPGYVSANAPITGWTVSDPNRAGLNNPSAGLNYFADNGIVPNGDKVAFLQSGANLSTTMSGLIAGQTYLVTFRANSQIPVTAGQLPNIHITAAGTDIWSLTCNSRGTNNPYGYLAFEFTATAASEPLVLANDSIWETALLVDDFKIAPSTGKWTIAAWNDDTDSGVDPSYVYTHAYNFGSAASPVINSIVFTGVNGINPAVAGSFSTANFANIFSTPDDNNVTGSGSVLADQFVYQGGDIGTNAETIVITGLTNGTEYVATIYSVGWESPSADTRWMTLNAEGNYLTFNQDILGNNNGIRCSYRYTADATGTATLRILPVNPVNTSMHVYGFSNREAVSRNVKPEITLQPQGATVAEGLEVVLKVGATGFPAPTYRWRLNGTDITGANTDTHTFTAAPALAGNYDVVIANLLGSVTSRVARVSVGMSLANPSFEADLFAVWPGYVSDNGPITGWTSLNNHGLNPVSDGRSPFADNGSIPHGTHAAFMQGDGVLSQTVSGFTVGSEYYLHYYENGRNDGNDPGLEVKLGANTLIPAHVVTPVGGSNPYHEISSEVFIANAAALDLSFVKSNPLGGDSTVVIDNVTILRVPSGTPPSMGLQPQAATVYVGDAASFSGQAQGSLPLHYQWRLNGNPVANATDTTFSIPRVGLADEGYYSVVVTNSFGSVTSAVVRLSLLEKIPSLRSTGIDGSGAPLPAGAVEPFWTLLTNPDGGSSDVYVANEAWPIAAGVWMLNSATSKWVGSRAEVGNATIPAGDYRYRTTFDLTGRDTNTVIITGQWATDDAGTVVSVNGATVNVPMSVGFGSWTSFTIGTNNATFLQGTNTIDFGLNNGGVGPTGLRVEFTRTSARTLPGVPAAIATQPQGGTFVEGETATLSVAATGTLPISYQWTKNGVNLSGKTDASLTLTGLTTSDSGSYRVAVSNAWGSALSAEAIVTVAYRLIPGVYGTGVNTNGQLLAGGEVDPHFILGASADPSYAGPNAIIVNDGYPIGTWLNNGPNSKWIAPWANQNDSGASGGGNLGGSYTYQTSVNLTGYDVSKVRIVGAWCADDAGTDILVNGVSLGLTSVGFTALTPFVITNNLVAGVNTLDFVINNTINANGTPNPTGLRVDLRAMVAIDQPPTMQISRNGNNISISWSPDTAGLKLQSANGLGGPWNNVANQSNPYTTTATGTQFFRLSR